MSDLYVRKTDPKAEASGRKVHGSRQSEKQIVPEGCVSDACEQAKGREERGSSPEGQVSRDLFARARRGDKGAKEQLLAENEGLLYMVLKRYVRDGCDREELKQVCVIGMLRAIEGFEPGRGYAFSTYAVPMMIGELRRFFREDHLLHINRPIRENARRIQFLREEWIQTHGREPTMRELAAQSGLSREEILLAVGCAKPVDSLNRPVSEGREWTADLGDQIPDSCSTEKQAVDRLAVRQLLDSLPQEERRLLELRYLENHTQADTARILGTTQVTVSRREKRILEKLRRSCA